MVATGSELAELSEGGSVSGSQASCPARITASLVCGDLPKRATAIAMDIPGQPLNRVAVVLSPTKAKSPHGVSA